MMKALFVAHPKSVGESYLEHQHAAMSFAAQLLAASLACVVHAVVPGLFTNTASRTIDRLHTRLVVSRRVPRRAEMEDKSAAA